ncbi:MAG: Phosphate transport system regulatory protein PhoU [uncultured Thiotrichaceae bacterium]|uniref:Phosphate-specific transport system accessory protein PhoU n=1 Tax=uncultured Thiotrichaceae bacterium TaxID=298394 RepID=A0A6S6UJN0_9GAMM|nr:MAG: Phosphate transport system regulatory protein PhoU [uncultured Thiotrichaceae bacterium]
MSTQHILKPFDRDLKSVHNRVVGMAEMVSQELTDCFNAFVHRDKLEASDAVVADDLINASERIIDDLIVKTIVLHQPMAADCRLLIAALRVSKDLERIGDYATNIANHSRTLDELELTGQEQAVFAMGETVQDMMEDVIHAYTNNDAITAENVRQQDGAVDDTYTAVFANLIATSTEKPELSAACTHLVFIARSLERIGDHITDIAEEVLFVVNGVFPEDDRLKADVSAFVKG